MCFRKKHCIVLVILILTSFAITVLRIPKEENVFKNMNSKIDKTNIEKTIAELTSKEYNGRLVGTKGNRLATDYIVNEFRKMGLKNPDNIKGYEQPFRQNVRSTNTTPKLLITDNNKKTEKTFKYIEDFSPITYNSMLSIAGDAKGKGILLKSIDELSKSRDVFSGKILLVEKRLIKNDGFRNIILNIIENKLDISGIVVEVEVEKKKNSTFPVAPNALPVDTFKKGNPILFAVDKNTFAELVDSIETKRDIFMSADYSIENVKGSNVVGIIEGSDEKLKDEHIVIGAHFDHAGDNKDGTFNPGALDNASGTASMIEIARTIMRSKEPPKKTIVFIGFNGEEEGLYGSYHYVENPVKDLNDKTVMINLDMVGSKRKVPLELVSYDSRDVEFRNLLFKLGHELELDVKTGVSQGSDHVPFAVKGIKAVCLINMDLESGYHTPIDTLDKVDVNRSKEICDLVLYYLDKEVY